MPALLFINSKHQISNNIKILNSNDRNSDVLNFGHCNLKFICYLGFVIWNFLFDLLFGARDLEFTNLPVDIYFAINR